MEIVLVAKEIFAKHGYKKSTLEDIANSLDIVKSALYHYYKNKEDIFCSVIEFEIDTFFNKLNIDIRKSSSTKGKLLKFSKNKYLYYKQFLNLYNLTVDDLYENYKNIIKIREGFIRKNIEFVEAILQADSSLRDRKEIRDWSRIFIFSVRGIIKNSYQNDRMKNQDREIELFIDIFLKGIKGI